MAAFDNPHDEAFAAATFGLKRGEPLKVGREQNTGVCWKYVAHWGVRELLRELVQNLIDAVNVSIKSIGPELTVAHINLACTDGAANFEWTVVPGLGKPPVVLGSIKYDDNSKQLTLTNKGVIPMEGLLMGGGVKAGAEPDPNIAGRFGEGLKLAVLCALRSKKTITIKTGGHLWTFGLRWDPFFGQHCVYFLIDEDKTHDPEWTTIVVGGLSREEWVSNPVENQGIHAFLALRDQLGENIGAIPSHKPGLGSLLIGPHVRGCLFVKGIFVNRPKHGANQYEFGYSFTEMKLDRDRNTTIDQNELIQATSSLIVDVLHNWQELGRRYPAAAQFDSMVEMVYKSLTFDSWETLEIHSKWQLAGGRHPVCTALLDRWRALNNIPVDEMPVHSVASILQQRVEYGLSADFYVTHYVSSRQMANFCRGERFESLVQRMERLTQQELHAPGLAHPSFLKALALWQQIEPGFGQDAIRFTNLAYHQNYMLQNVIYLSRFLLDDAAVQQHDGHGTSSVKKLVAQIAVFRKIPVARLFGLFQV